MGLERETARYELKYSTCTQRDTNREKLKKYYTKPQRQLQYLRDNNTV